MPYDRLAVPPLAALRCPDLMRRPGDGKRSKLRRGREEAAGNPVRAVVRVDGAPIRDKLRKEHEKASRDLENARRQVEYFHQVDGPEFARWLNSRFGALLTELRELGHKVMADEALVSIVEDEAMLCGIPLAKAYQRVMTMRDASEEPPPQRSDADGTADGRPHPNGGPEAAGPSEAEELEREFFERLLGEMDDERGGGPLGRRPVSGVTAEAASRLKELYRAVVRRLHPDTQAEMTAQKTEWWHQAQAAYNAGDADQLEVILTFCEIHESGTTAHTSAGLLLRIIAQTKRGLREVRRQISRLHADPAWDFSRRKDKEAYAFMLERRLTEDLRVMRAAADALADMIDWWKAKLERSSRPRRRKESPKKPGP
ncbi:MAG: hypothetical protein WCP53_01505 [Verrucomicrobiota bacterium]